MADQTKHKITEKNGVELEFEEELDLIPSNIPFDGTNRSYRSTDLDEVADEIREKQVQIPEYTTSTLNGSLLLTNESNTLQIINGTATGFKVFLPNATTLFLGEKYQIINNSSEQIEIYDFTGTLLLTLNPDDTTGSILENNTTTAGTWFQIVTAVTAAGITSYDLISSTTFTTTSTTDILVSSFSFTPVSGRYSIWFSSDIIIEVNNRIAQCVIYKDGLPLGSTRRNVQGVSSNFVSNQQTLGIINVNGTEVVDVRVNISGGNLTLNGRTLTMIRLGGVV